MHAIDSPYQNCKSQAKLDYAGISQDGGSGGRHLRCAGHLFFLDLVASCIRVSSRAFIRSYLYDMHLSECIFYLTKEFSVN